MKETRYTEEQIAFALRQAEAGVPVEDICRKMGVSEPTYYRWKKQFTGMGVPEIRRLKQLEEENRKLKQLVADLSLDKKMSRTSWEKSSDPAPLDLVQGAGQRSTRGTTWPSSTASDGMPNST